MIGSTVELVVQAHSGRKAGQTERQSGRASDGRLVHFAPTGAIDRALRAGDVVTTTVTDATPFFLLADDGVITHRRTLAGDNVEAQLTPTTAPVGVSLGMPGMGKPAPAQPSAHGCGCSN